MFTSECSSARKFGQGNEWGGSGRCWDYLIDRFLFRFCFPTYSRDDATRRSLVVGLPEKLWSSTPNCYVFHICQIHLSSTAPRNRRYVPRSRKQCSRVGAVDPVVKVEAALLPSPSSQFKACAPARTSHPPPRRTRFLRGRGRPPFLPPSLPPSLPGSLAHLFLLESSDGRVCSPPSKTKLPLQRRRCARRGGGGAIAERCDRALHFPPPPLPREKSHKTLGLPRGRKPEQNIGTESEVRIENILAARQHR